MKSVQNWIIISSDVDSFTAQDDDQILPDKKYFSLGWNQPEESC